MSSSGPIHLTSYSAYEKGSNVFIWTPAYDYERIAFSWRIDGDQPMTHKTLYRWIDTIVKEEHEIHQANTVTNYLIFPVKISRNDERPLAYIIEHTKPQSKPLPRDGEGLLEAGDYGIYYPDGSESRLPYLYFPRSTLMSQKRTMAMDQDLVSVLIDPPKEDVMRRDGNKCSITGVELPESDLDVTWIMPPHMFSMMPLHEGKRDEAMQLFGKAQESRSAFMEPMITIRNCLQMSSDVIKLFQANQITIDVDDNYRIFHFFGRDLLEKDLKNPLKTHLDSDFKKQPHRVGDDFLRAHFLYSLAAQVYRGDIADEYNASAVEVFMIEMRNSDFDKSRWQSGLGLQVRAWLRGEEPLTWDKMPDPE